jgi:hypothetical protein
VDAESSRIDRSFSVLTRVRCLDCGLAYAKPTEGGTAQENPGCPRCGYLGWIPASAEVTASPPSRSVVDLRRHRVDRSR